MPYTIVILRRAQKELAELPLEAYTRIRDAIRKLGEEPLLNCANKHTRIFFNAMEEGEAKERKELKNLSTLAEDIAAATFSHRE